MAGKVRQPIDLASLSDYIEEYVPSIALPISVLQFGFGQSNPTYQLTAKDGKKYVLRKKPPGRLVSKTAHKVEREYRVLRALEKTGVPAPKVYCLCEESHIIGTPFYIMEFLEGRIFEDAAMPNVSIDERTEMWREAIQTLAKLHRIIPKDIGLETFGKPSSFYNRQIATFSAVSAAQAKTIDVETHEPVGSIPYFDEMLEFFKIQELQPNDRGTLIHGDYKIDNLVFHKTAPKVIGVLDWEMATVGHPLSDLINLIGPFLFTESDLDPQPSFRPGATPGLPTKEQVVEWYAEAARWDPKPVLVWGSAFGIFRNSVIIQGVAARCALKQASSAVAHEIVAKLKPFANHAYQLVGKARKGTRGIDARL